MRFELDEVTAIDSHDHNGSDPPVTYLGAEMEAEAAAALAKTKAQLAGVEEKRAHETAKLAEKEKEVAVKKKELADARWGQRRSRCGLNCVASDECLPRFRGTRRFKLLL